MTYLSIVVIFNLDNRAEPLWKSSMTLGIRVHKNGYKSLSKIEVIFFALK